MNQDAIHNSAPTPKVVLDAVFNEFAEHFVKKSYKASKKDKALKKSVKDFSWEFHFRPTVYNNRNHTMEFLFKTYIYPDALNKRLDDCGLRGLTKIHLDASSPSKSDLCDSIQKINYVDPLTRKQLIADAIHMMERLQTEYFEHFNDIEQVVEEAATNDSFQVSKFSKVKLFHFFGHKELAANIVSTFFQEYPEQLKELDMYRTEYAKEGIPLNLIPNFVQELAMLSLKTDIRFPA